MVPNNEGFYLGGHRGVPTHSPRYRIIVAAVVVVGIFILLVGICFLIMKEKAGKPVFTNLAAAKSQVRPSLLSSSQGTRTRRRPRARACKTDIKARHYKSGYTRVPTRTHPEWRAELTSEYVTQSLG